MSNTPARVPFARTNVLLLSDADLNLQRIESLQKGLFQPRVLVFGMGGSPSPYVVRGTDWLILCDCTNGAITLTFPLAARLDGLYVTVVKTDSTANAVTLSGTFNGGANPTLAVRYASKIVQAGNAVWYFTPTISAADVTPGTFPSGAYTFPGALTTATSMMSPFYRSFGATVLNVLNNTATTLFAIPALNGIIEIYVEDPDSSAASSSADARIRCLGGTYVSVFNNGSKMVLSLSGSNLQATQTSGITQNVTYVYTWTVA